MSNWIERVKFTFFSEYIYNRMVDHLGLSAFAIGGCVREMAVVLEMAATFICICHLMANADNPRMGFGKFG